MKEILGGHRESNCLEVINLVVVIVVFGGVEDREDSALRHWRGCSLWLSLVMLYNINIQCGIFSFAF